MDRVKLYDRNGKFTGKFIEKSKAINEYKRHITGSNAAFVPNDIWNQIVTEANRNGYYIQSQLAMLKRKVA